MIVTAIAVSGWRCFLEETNVGPFTEGLNVIHAPNGTGKSTLFEAMQRGLLDAHGVTGHSVEAIRPWGRSLAPRVTIEFEHTGQAYRVTKQYLDGPTSGLERQEDGRFRPVAEGRAADDEVRAILHGEAPGRGATKQQHWGIAQILWAPQGDLALASLSGDLIANIHSLLGVQLSSAEGGRLEKKVDDLYYTYFTAGGSLKTGRYAPLTQLEQRLQAAELRCCDAEERQIDFEEASRRVEDLRLEQRQARVETEELRRSLKKARERAQTYNHLKSEYEAHEKTAEAAQAKHEALKARIDGILGIRKQVDQAQEENKDLTEALRLYEREYAGRQKAFAAAQAELEDARSSRPQVDEAAELADTARRYLETSIRAKAVGDTLERIEKVEAELVQRREERAAVAAPDTRQLRAIRKCIRDRDDARRSLEASLITLEIVPEKDGRLRLLAGESIGEQEVHAGEPTQVKGSPEVVADIEGLGRVRAWGPEGSVEDHRKALQKAAGKLAERTEPFGTQDLDVLEKRQEDAQALDEKITQSEAILETLLGEATKEELLQQRAAIRAATTAFLEAHPQWEDRSPDADDLHTQAEDIRARFVLRIEPAEADWQKAQTALSQSEGQKEKAELRIHGGLTHVEELSARLQELTSDGKSDEVRRQELGALALEWDAAREKTRAVQELLDEYDADPTEEVGRLDQSLQATEERATQSLEREKLEEGKLQNLAAAGPYSDLAAAEEELAALREQLQAEQQHIAAIELLRDTLATCRAEAVAAVVGPVELSATRLFHRIAGRRLGGVALGEAFSPDAVTPAGASSLVDVENLSGGEKEQLYIATRLALADLLAKEERQLVVLDDVLTFTDTGRLARVMGLLEEAAERLQVLILTCHPERYATLRDARLIDLEALSSHE